MTDTATDPATLDESDGPYTDPRFHPLTKEFRGLYQGRKDGGGALAVYLHGEPVVDVWAGYADVRARTPWTRETMSMSYSTSKGVTATVVHRLVQRGVLDVDQPVTTWWPEFGVKGKGDITLSDIMTHCAGLSRVRGVAETPGDLLDVHRMGDRLASRAPDPDLRGRPAYHGLTFGYLVANIVERATGKPFPQVLKEEVSDPLGLDGMFISTPTDHHHRIAPFYQTIAPLGVNLATAGHYLKWVPRLRAFVDALLPHGFEDFVNTPAMWEAVVPAANGIFTARALAKMYAPLANGGMIGDQQFLEPEVLEQAGKVRTRKRDAVLGMRMRWRLGYHQGFVASRDQPSQAFGHFGLGGSGAWADPESGMAMAFVTNRLGAATTPIADVRLAKLGSAALDCLR